MPWLLAINHTESPDFTVYVFAVLGVTDVSGFDTSGVGVVGFVVVPTFLFVAVTGFVVVPVLVPLAWLTINF